MGNAHEFSVVHQGTGSTCNAHGESSRGWVLLDSHLIFSLCLGQENQCASTASPATPRQKTLALARLASFLRRKYVSMDR